jgi:hypothetical protein
METSIIPLSKENTHLNLSFPKKPSINPQKRTKPITLISNYLKISLKSNHRRVKQYSIKYSPEIPADNGFLRRSIIRQLTSELNNFYEPFFDSGDCFFSPQDVYEQKYFSTTIKASGNDPEITDSDYILEISRTDNQINLEEITKFSSFSMKTKNFLEVLIKKIVLANSGIMRFNNREYFDFNSNPIELGDSSNTKK